MNQIEPESGFVGSAESECYIGSAMTDVEILCATGSNVLARGRRYGRQWLLKGLRPEFRDSTQMLRQLTKEFEIHSRLNHPGVAQAVGFEEIEGIGRCVVEEWVDGTTLADAMRRGSLTAKERKRIVRQIVGSVAYLHGKGVVHRDLKPSNVMIRNAGDEPVLIDFGLADTDDYVELKSPAGTEGFISPQQRESGGAHPSDDVYSLGVIIKDLCPAYGRIARRCMGPLERRPADARALLRLIERTDRRPRILGGASVGVIALALLLFAGLRMSTLSRSSQQARARVEVLTDSLSEVRRQLQQIEVYDRLRENAIEEGHRRVDSVLIAYDTEVFGPMTAAQVNAVTPAVNRLLADLRQTAENYCESLDSCGLRAHDIEQTRIELYNYYTITMANYHSKWMKKMFPQMNQMR
ncbi:MAG: serine/threonine protein kinase [Muribaculaceae bacterium]|nr:serine/threonine protein kinase [Muribaculaceae bacterium]